MNKDFRIPQANLNKSRGALHALHNDETLAGFHFILAQEPSRGRTSEAALHEPAVDGIRPEQQEAAQTLHQIVHLSVQGGGNHAAAGRLGRRAKEGNPEELTGRLNRVNELVQIVLLRDPHTDVVDCGRLQLTQPSVGRSHISSVCGRKRAHRIIDFIAELSLQSLLPTEVITFVSGAGRMSTIDSMLTTPALARDLAELFGLGV
ncbi:hypothetical protein DL768_008349 [Monosporascus sp. mg162]|nr:hypothetical protein DL768_008349 [Monosporascus sp. mg162]